MNGSRAALLALVCAFSGSALAVPETFTFAIAVADGTLNGVPFTLVPVVAVLQADTSAVVSTVVAGGPGNCVAPSSGTVTVGGGAPLALSPPLFVCAGSNGTIIYLGPTNNAPDPTFTFVVGGYNPPPGGSYNLNINYPPTPNLPGEIGSGAALNTAGGPLILTDETVLVYSASVQSVIPALSPGALVFLALALALLSLGALKRQGLKERGRPTGDRRPLP